ncbi:MAG TPA: hypothetical protein VMU14_14380 [Acidimicrobiales bacterium]|nr:hypothetical protein [Acidimicrobiales bacterium]
MTIPRERPRPCHTVAVARHRAHASLISRAAVAADLDVAEFIVVSVFAMIAYAIAIIAVVRLAAALFNF